MPIITVVGSLNMDLVVRTPRIPVVGETLSGSDIQFIPGGKGGNQAIASSRAGAETHFIGCVGSDSFGPVLLQSLQQAHVNTQNISTLDGVPTGAAIILLEANSDNRIIIIPGANSQVTPQSVLQRWDDISSSNMLILQHEIPLETVKLVIEKAHHADIQIVLNPAPIYPISDELLAKIDFLIVNETEASVLSGQAVSSCATAITAAEQFFQRGVKTAIVTLGGEGAVLVSRGYRIYQPAFEVEVVDTTAAGDTFVGSFAACTLEGLPPPEAMLYAAAAAGLAVSKLGAQPSIPDRQDVEMLIQNVRRENQ